ncbi:hypothetical protein B5E87_02680 [Massilimicrobiota sp. An142]|uniref:LytTR family DNA-binding domain-containing protein n=1 Tax=Massilimicrobiota sp. An142 TaxID=1965564 RepID=UPI000B382D12|nr:LytTR family DNA-binding domain-containing protein [Massilimicrobiota sp. An142]OUQ14404.1 hypothetical protein B5E87_02680 [Massilimicrobiota sp. An142]
MKITFNFDRNISRNEIILFIHPNYKNICKNFKIKIRESFQLIQVYDDQNNMYPIPLISILYIEIVDRKIFAYTQNQQYILHMTSLKEFQRKIKSKDFYRITHSVLVNKNSIVSIKIIGDKKRLILLTNNEHLQVSREYADKSDHLVLNL